eukprot:g43223.t1
MGSVDPYITNEHFKDSLKACVKKGHINVNIWETLETSQFLWWPKVKKGLRHVREDPIDSSPRLAKCGCYISNRDKKTADAGIQVAVTLEETEDGHVKGGVEQGVEMGGDREVRLAVMGPPPL